MEYRKSIMGKHGHHVVDVKDDERIRPAIMEYYTFMLGTFLPLRFPSVFKIHEADFEQGKAFMLHNEVTGTLYPVHAGQQAPTKRLLETLGRTVDEDILFLLPESEKEDAKYVLQGFIVAYPSGFDTAEKLGKRLAAIHEPVPGYAAKIEGSMDRFFAKLEVGKYVRRVNWSLTTNTELYAGGAGTNHAHEGDEIEELDKIDLDKTFLRCERQTLHRLPKSKAIVFAFHTYIYPIKQIKEEGGGEELATAIDGLREGNVPQMHFYKRGVVWGEAVKNYLRAPAEDLVAKASSPGSETRQDDLRRRRP